MTSRGFRHSCSHINAVHLVQMVVEGMASRSLDRCVQAPPKSPKVSSMSSAALSFNVSTASNCVEASQRRVCDAQTCRAPFPRRVSMLVSTNRNAVQNGKRTPPTVFLLRAMLVSAYRGYTARARSGSPSKARSCKP